MCIDVYIYIYVVSKKNAISTAAGAPTCKNPTHGIWSLQIERSKNGGSNKKLPGPSIFFGKGAFGMVITGHYNQHNPLRPLKCSPQKSSRKNTWKNDPWTILSLTFRWLSQRRTFAFSFWGVLHMESIKITSNICTKFYPPKNGSHVTATMAEVFHFMDFSGSFLWNLVHMAPLVSPSTPPIMV